MARSHAKGRARQKARRRWVQGRTSRGLPAPTLEEVWMFAAAFNMGWNARGKHLRAKGLWRPGVRRPRLKMEDIDTGRPWFWYDEGDLHGA